MENRALIMTVGVGGKDPDSLFGALCKSIDEVHPNILGLVYSAGSTQIATRLKEDFANKFEIHDLCLTDPDDVDKSFQQILEFISRLETQHGCDTRHMRVDFTSGTKAMSAAVVLAGVTCNIEKFQYVTGERRDGVVQAGMEKILSLSPARYQAQRNLQIAENHLRHLRYEVALDIVDHIPTQALGESERIIQKGLHSLCKIYRAWDIFQHEEALMALKDLIKEKQVYEVKASLQGLLPPKEVCSSLDYLVRHLSPEKPTYSEFVLADLYNNAQRRMIEGKYDDACARLYRLTEMIAQAGLQKHGIDTSHVREDQVPQDYRSKVSFEQTSHGKEAKVPLQKSYELLSCLGDSFGNLLDKSLSNFLSKRNLSILAHGTKPISKEACEKLINHLNPFLAQHFQNWEQIVCQLQFPWLKA